MDQTGIGRRVAYWRRRRNLSQRVFADRIGRSKSWVEKVERGTRQLDRFSLIQQIADELNVDVALLVGTGAPHPASGVGDNEPAEVAAVREALEHYAWPDDVGPSSPVVDLDELRASVAHAWAAYQRAAYDTVALVVPGLLGDVQALTRCTGRHRPVALRLRCEAYQVTAALLTKLEAYAVAWLAADRAVGAAQVLTAGPGASSGEPSAHPDDREAAVLAGSATAGVGVCLLRAGRPDAAERVCLARAQAMIRTSRTGRPASRDRVATVGVLLSVARLAAAAAGERERADRLRTSLDRRAGALGSEVEVRPFTFGPTSLLLDDVSVAVEAGDAVTALRLHAALPAGAVDNLAPQRRGEHLLTVARARLLSGDPVGAGRAVLQAERRAAGEVLHSPAGHRVLRALTEADPRTLSPEVAALAQRTARQAAPTGKQRRTRAGAAQTARRLRPRVRAEPTVAGVPHTVSDHSNGRHRLP